MHYRGDETSALFSFNSINVCIYVYHEVSYLHYRFSFHLQMFPVPCFGFTWLALLPIEEELFEVK